MMMVWMALRSHMGVHDSERHLGTRAQGGGGRRAKPLLQSKLGREGLEGIVEMDSTRTLNHLSPKGLVGFSIVPPSKEDNKALTTDQQDPL